MAAALYERRANSDRHRPLLQISLKPRSFFAPARAHFGPPTELLQYWIRFVFDRIGNDFAQHRREFESVAAVAGRDD